MRIDDHHNPRESKASAGSPPAGLAPRPTLTRPADLAQRPRKPDLGALARLPAETRTQIHDLLNAAQLRSIRQTSTTQFVETHPQNLALRLVRDAADLGTPADVDAFAADLRTLSAPRTQAVLRSLALHAPSIVDSGARRQASSVFVEAVKGSDTLSTPWGPDVGEATPEERAAMAWVLSEPSEREAFVALMAQRGVPRATVETRLARFDFGDVMKTPAGRTAEQHAEDLGFKTRQGVTLLRDQTTSGTR